MSEKPNIDTAQRIFKKLKGANFMSKIRYQLNGKIILRYVTWLPYEDVNK